ncbi:MAG: hypothetical protein JXA78_15415 [Anaerolineales bacterium]|nr:hypothetical protein [Anaerolineales bacterium]
MSVLKSLLPVMLAAALLLSACLPVQPAPQTAPAQQEAFSPEVSELPVYIVVQGGVDPEAARRLASLLELEDVLLDEDGVLRYLDQERFAYVPTSILGQGEPDEDGQATLLEAIDFEALRQVTVLDDQAALQKAEDALARAGLREFTGTPELAAVPYIDHSMLDWASVDGAEVGSLALDTQVIYRFELEGAPLIGPGAKAKLVFDSGGAVTHLYYTMRRLQRGENVPITPPSQGDELCAQALAAPGDDPNLSMQISSLLVYYAPAPHLESVRLIYPHYLCSATVSYVDERGGEGQYQAKSVFVPAIAEGGLQVELNAAVEGGWVRAQAEASGGAPPYSYAWSSATTALEPDTALAGPQVEYFINSRQAVNEETIGLTVTDANGLAAWARQTLAVDAAALPRAHTHALATPPRDDRVLDIGVEWVGLTANPPLIDSSAKITRFLGRLDTNISVTFNWGEQDAWERDFRDFTKTIWFSPHGDDNRWVDNVDLAFFSGHGDPNGPVFSSNLDARNFSPSSALWGDRDLEWIVFSACNVLSGGSMGSYRADAVARWKEAFAGLHMILGYASPTAEDAEEGWHFANYMLGSPAYGKPAYKIRHAWVLAANDTQKSPISENSSPGARLVPVYSAVMFPVRNDYVTNMNEYFHGKGYVGPDIQSSETRYFMRMTFPIP